MSKEKEPILPSKLFAALSNHLLKQPSYISQQVEQKLEAHIQGLDQTIDIVLNNTLLWLIFNRLGLESSEYIDFTQPIDFNELYMTDKFNASPVGKLLDTWIEHNVERLLNQEVFNKYIQKSINNHFKRNMEHVIDTLIYDYKHPSMADYAETIQGTLDHQIALEMEKVLAKLTEPSPLLGE